MSLNPNTTAVVFIGAETFLKSGFNASTAFTEAKSRIISYFQDLLRIAPVNILDLFDSERSADDQDSSIVAFVKKMVSDGIQDLFIYYVGHGSFTPGENAFYLALKNTRDDNPGISSLTINTLGNTISRHANSIRTFAILDCCFSGAAGMGFMSAADQGPAIQLKDSFPAKGVAIFCATSKDLPALIVSERNVTMFTEGFELALKNGDPMISEKFLSLRQLQHLTYSFIKEKNPGQAIRPEILSPMQGQGDLADMELFQNFGYEEARYDIEAQRNVIIKEMVANNFVNLGNIFLDFVREHDRSDDLLLESILLASECNELAKENISKSEYTENKKAVYRDIMNTVKVIIENSKSVQNEN